MDIKNKEELMMLQQKKVVEHNHLIQSVAKMDKAPLKIFELAVAHIDVNNPPLDNTVKLSKKSLFAFFDVEDADRHSRFKEALLKLHQQAVFQVKKESLNGKYKFEIISPLAKTEWNDYSDDIYLKFTDDIMPYLIDLKSNFTQYTISDIMYLNSKYSVIIYKWLSMYHNQFEHYKSSSTRSAKQLESYRNPTITVEKLRELTDTKDELLRFFDFEKRVLKPAQKEISEHTHFDISYKKIKKGKFIDSIQFFITKKNVADYSFYKEEQKDPAYLEDKVLTEQQKNENYVAAQQSVYTKILLQNDLIDVTDLLEKELMLDLGAKVYPLYDTLKSLTNMNEVERHISYVKEKQKDYTRKNKPKYLMKAIEGYISYVQFKQDNNNPYNS